MTTCLRLSLQIWMLTGDKSETAVNIGFATQMLTNDMELLLYTVEALNGPKRVVDELEKQALQISKNAARGTGM